MLSPPPTGLVAADSVPALLVLAAVALKAAVDVEAVVALRFPIPREPSCAVDVVLVAPNELKLSATVEGRDKEPSVCPDGG